MTEASETNKNENKDRFHVVLGEHGWMVCDHFVPFAGPYASEFEARCVIASKGVSE